MKFIVNTSMLVIFLYLLIGCARSIPHHTADHAHHCHVQDAYSKTHHVEVGDKISVPGKCQEATCQKDFSVGLLRCAAAAVPIGCTKTKIDYSKLFPDCCPKVVCKSKDY